MDTEKLLRILKDLQQEEQSLGIDSKVDAMRNSIGQNNPEGFEAAQTQLAELIEQVKTTSIIYKFSQTEFLLLSHIKGETYFGRGLITQLNKIFAARSFEIIGKIDEYRSQRNDFIQRAQKLTTSLIEMGFEEYRPDSYEVGFVLPGEQANIGVVLDRVRDLELLLSAISEGVYGKNHNIKITRVSNGSLEFFSLQPFDVALLLSSLLLNITQIWDKIAKFRKKMEETDKDDDLSPEAKSDINKALKKETEKIKEEILKDLPANFLKQLDKGRANEIRNQIRISVKAIFAWFEAGIEIDITPIRVNNTENAANAEEGEKVNSIREAGIKLRKIYKLPIELRKLPFSLPEPKVEDETPETTEEEGKK